MAQKALYRLFVVGALLCAVGAFLFFQHSNGFAQTPYYGPTSPEKGVIPIEIQIYDDPELGGVVIQNASFDGQSIPLKPTGIHGFRGGGSFKKRMGSYLLIWTTSRGGNDWPRSIQHQQKVQIKQNDVWVQIAIHGEQLTIL